MPPSPRPAVVIFDGECGLCNAFVAWLIRRDAAGLFRVAGSAGEVGKAALDAAGLDRAVAASTLVVWDGAAHVKSDAVARVARGLPWPWRAAAGMVVVPRALRDRVYDAVAARRSRAVADDPACGVPPAALVDLWRSRLATTDDVARLTP